jgi:hypothetical protein
MLPFAAGLMGLFLIVVAFVSVTNAPSGAVERYIDTPAYLLLVIPSAIVCLQLFSSRRKLAVACTILLLFTAVYLGSSSPDWAQFENPSYSAVRYTFTGYVEVGILENYVPVNSTLYADYDLHIGASSSYQIIRPILNLIKVGALNPFNPISEDSTEHTPALTRLSRSNWLMLQIQPQLTNILRFFTIMVSTY